MTYKIIDIIRNLNFLTIIAFSPILIIIHFFTVIIIMINFINMFKILHFIIDLIFTVFL